MKQSVLLFITGVLLALLAVGGYLAGQMFFASADTDIVPENLTIKRISPTSALISFTTKKNIISSIECADDIKGNFSLCGAETEPTSSHKIKTSIILNPEKKYYFFIKIKNTTYDNLGKPFEIPIKKDSKPFADELLGICRGETKYNEVFDVNKDGCIRTNDKFMYLSRDDNTNQPKP